MNRSGVLLALLSSWAGARPAEITFTGRLERVGSASVSVRVAEGPLVHTTRGAATIDNYEIADQVEVTCIPIKAVYDAQAGLHYHLQLARIRLVRRALPEERAETIALLSWQRGENLLKLPAAPVPPPDASELERVRQVNLEYVAKRENFVADEIQKRYISQDSGKPWRLQDTIEAEIAFKDGQLTRQNIRRNGKPWPKPFHKLGGILIAGFGAQIKPLFDPACSVKINFAGRQEASGQPMLIYLFRSPAQGCFGEYTWNGNLYNPPRTGRVLVDPARGNTIRYEDEASGFPEKYGLERVIWVDSWDYVTIGQSSHLVPVARIGSSPRSAGQIVV
ncbi:exported hypothetical protein [Candidatus Sulfopaludibacter sp. SbA3]|nr:exported hypothetical protein [Candidatus Sulfopaludibacter sp. SbA3]